jgi:hypothetical protein
MKKIAGRRGQIEVITRCRVLRPPPCRTPATFRQGQQRSALHDFAVSSAKPSARLYGKQRIGYKAMKGGPAP